MSRADPPNSFAETHSRARQLQAAGHLVEAINLQLNLIRRARHKGVVAAEYYHSLGVMFFAARDFPNAAAAFACVQRMDPGFHAVAMNLGLSLVRCRRGACFTLCAIMVRTRRSCWPGCGVV
ncbi:MAG TPA: hypothetical protein ENJ80_06775 [Gammaproteobacteria bacterium]|nr:hypothetical protein [Gammaproteobacteria bacterium]